MALKAIQSGSFRQGRDPQLAPGVRDVITRAISRYGVDSVVSLIGSIAKDRSRSACHAMVRALLRDASKRYHMTTIRLWMRVAAHYEAATQQLDLPTVAPKTAAATHVPESQDIPQAELVRPDPVQQLAEALAGVLKTRQADAVPEPGAQEFPELKPAMQRAVLNSMHDRYAKKLRAAGVEERCFAEAWRQSYQAFYRATGIDVEQMASEESDSSGKRIRPLDIIDRAGWLVRFWNIVRKTWE